METEFITGSQLKRIFTCFRHTYDVKLGEHAKIYTYETVGNRVSRGYRQYTRRDVYYDLGDLLQNLVDGKYVKWFSIAIHHSIFNAIMKKEYLIGRTEFVQLYFDFDQLLLLSSSVDGIIYAMDLYEVIEIIKWCTKKYLHN